MAIALDRPTPTIVRRGDARRAVREALVGAALFGASPPIAKRLLATTPPLVLAGLLYVGAGTALAIVGAMRRRDRAAAREAPLTRGDAPLLAAVVACGGLAGPLLMLFGLSRLSGLTASLLLNLEVPFTVLLAVFVFGEHLGGREAAGIALVVAGAAALGAPEGILRGDWLGVAAMAAACLAWAVDNNLTQRLSLRDPIAVARAKGLAAGMIGLGLAWVTGAAPPAAATVIVALLLGAASYGASLALSVRAMRVLGAARQGGYFATAPFAGAAVAVVAFGDRPHAVDLCAASAMAAGIGLLLRAVHDHEHTHEVVEHEHRHEHDAHHTHQHARAEAGPHSHVHVHEPLTHAHAHVSDVHHRHRH